MNFSTLERLNEFRSHGDPRADELVQYIMSSAEPLTCKKAIESLQCNQDITHLEDAVLKQFFEKESNFPEWTEKKKIVSASTFFRKHSAMAMQLLGFLSLPYCYAAEDGARVLFFSEQIRSNPAKRLGETAEFVFSLFQVDAFEPEGKGLINLLRVRLMHATVRYYLSRNPAWNTRDWGLPINQEDMAGTNLAFSLILMRGLSKNDIRMSSAEKEAYLHFWSVCGGIMGIHEELITHTAKEAYWLEKSIRERHFRASDHGKALNLALVKTFQAFSGPEFSFFPEAYMRFLLGDEVSDMLGIAKLKLPKTILNVFQRAFKGSESSTMDPDLIFQKNWRLFRQRGKELNLNKDFSLS